MDVTSWEIAQVYVSTRGGSPYLATEKSDWTLAAKMAGDGWELVSVIPDIAGGVTSRGPFPVGVSDSVGYTMFFKRPIPNQDTTPLA